MSESVFPDASSPFGERVRRRLAEDRVGWLTTIGADGTPQPNPVWFLWDGADGILTYNRPDANRVTHIPPRPRVSFHLNGDDGGGDIVVLTGDAKVLQDAPLAHADAAYTAKYGEAAASLSGDMKKFAEAYPVAVHIRITRVRGF